MNRLGEIEKRLREIIEASSMARPWKDDDAYVVHQLCEAVQDWLYEEDLDAEIPSTFQIAMSPESVSRWKQIPDWQGTLVDALKSTFIEYGLKFRSTPAFILVARNSLESGQITINLKDSQLSEKTGSIPLKPGTASSENKKNSPCSNYLIAQGEKVILLEKKVINIGRKTGNDIVINDLRISRNHAQIRQSHEKFIIFDVGSTGGTFVNRERINQHTLRPGDVISLAGYTLIYVEELNDTDIPKKESTSEIKPTKGGSDK